MEQKEDTVEKARIVRADQGNHEVEISFSGEADLHRHFNLCPKNPGHVGFIPAPAFRMEHLQPQYRDQDILDRIRLLAEQTVRICVRYTSEDRPTSFPFYNNRGLDTARFGTGWITSVGKYPEGKKGPCKCAACTKSKEPVKDWGMVMVRTARHVVFDISEAKKMEAQLFYDSEKHKKDGSMVSLFGHLLHDCNSEDDWCDIGLVTHDLALCDRLETLCRRCFGKDAHLNSKFKTWESQLVVIASHPHGCSKQITVGEWKDRQHEWSSPSVYKYVLTYTADTCPGSSGAFVWRPAWWGFKSGRFSAPPHSEGLQNGLNRSGVGVNRMVGRVVQTGVRRVPPGPPLPSGAPRSSSIVSTMTAEDESTFPCDRPVHSGSSSDPPKPVLK